MQQAVRQAPKTGANVQANREKSGWTENRGIAKIIAALVVIFTVLVMGGIKLDAKRASVKKVFTDGVTENVVASVLKDIRRASDSANLLSGIAETKLTDDEDVKALRACVAVISETEDEEELLRSFSELKRATDNVYTKLEKVALSDADRSNARRAYDNIRSSFNTVGNDPYFARARAFNNDRNAFPARWIALISGVDELPTNIK